MLNHAYIPKAQKIKDNISSHLNIPVEQINFVCNKDDALITLILYYLRKNSSKRFVFPQPLIKSITHLKQLFPTLNFVALPTDNIISSALETLQKNDIFLITNPLLPFACLSPVKRLLKISNKKNSLPIFDISLSFYWLGYNLKKTKIYPTIFCLNPWFDNTYPFAIINNSPINSSLIGEIGAWHFDLKLDFKDKNKFIKELTELTNLLDKILTQLNIYPLCEKQILSIRTYLLPPKIDTNKISVLLQYSNINFKIIDNKLNIYFQTLDKDKLKQLNTLVEAN